MQLQAVSLFLEKATGERELILEFSTPFDEQGRLLPERDLYDELHATHTAVLEHPEEAQGAVRIILVPSWQQEKILFAINLKETRWTNH